MNAMATTTCPPPPIGDVGLTDAIERERPFSIVAAVHRPKMIEGVEQRSTWRSAVANGLYITRDVGRDLFGTTPAIPAEKQGDLGEHGRRGPIGCDATALAGIELWRAADAAAAIDRPELPAAFHAIGWLPLRMDEASWRNLILAFCDEVLVPNGMVADWAVHRRPDGHGSWLREPHVHLIITARSWRPERNPGRRNQAWFGSIASIKAAEDAWRTLLIEAADLEGRTP